MANAEVNELRELFKENKEQIIEDFMTYLRFKSISSEPEFKDDVIACADWLEGYLKDSGLEVSRWETSGYPVFMATYEVDPSKPTVMLYGHYDVQPVDPLELWDSPPFEPVIKDGEIYARGAQDNKGQCFYFISAVRALLKKHGTLPVNVKLIIEGEEEDGSAGMAEILEKHKSELKSDHLLIVDCGFHAPERPAVTIGVRGLVGITVKLTGSNTDLHSGSHGGLVYNPNRALVELLGKLFDDNGTVTVPGFYDNVQALTAEQKELINFEFDQEFYEQAFGAKANGGEKDRSPLESCWLRPTLEINGVGGGYAGKGFKTVIPAEAVAKLSCRLVPNQDPVRVGNLVAEFLKENCPEGIEIDVKVHEGMGAGLRAKLKSKVVLATAKAYEEVNELPCSNILEGASIPIVVDLAEAAEAEVVLMGYGLPGDQIHAPNEHFGIDRIEKGFLTIARTLQLIE